MRANDRQVGGSHYASDYQYWDFAMDANMNYLQGNAGKYVTRAFKKNGREDLEKALHYIDKCEERNAALVIHNGQTALVERFAHANNMDNLQFAAIFSIVLGYWSGARHKINLLIQALDQRTQAAQTEDE